MLNSKYCYMPGTGEQEDDEDNGGNPKKTN